MNRRLGRVAAGLAAMLLGCGYQEVPPPAKVVLPKPLAPEPSRAAIRMPAGLEVELVAAEPQVMDPVDVAWGPDGRMWVVEMADYPSGLDGRGKPGGRVRFLASTRGDGRYDRSTLFADGLRTPTTAVPWRNGVLVVTVPEIVYLEDTDGDGRADRREVLFRGLAEGNEQHLSNGLQWGLEGWLHLANGNSGGRIASVRTGQVVEVGQRDFRVHPDTGAIEVLAGASQAGRNRDDWGNWFGCNNSNPAWHFALEERYLRRNPHLVPPNPAVTIAAVPGAARVYPLSETLARFNDGFAANHFTSACGAMVYRDEFLGPEYENSFLVCEPVHNLVHRERLRPLGATFRSERVAGEETAEFLASTDNWSRFVAVRAGPDGALYVVDMYRLVIEHPKWIPEAWQRQLGDVRAGADRGRIFRVRPKGRTLRPIPNLAHADSRGLLAALESPSGIVRDLAQQQLLWRGAREVAPELTRLAAEAARPEARGQALWTLHGLGELTAAVVAQALQDPHPGVRRQAVRLSEGFANREATLGLRVAALAEDSDAAVRLQVAGTLGEWPGEAAGRALAQLLQHDPDRLIRAAAMSSALPHAETILATLATAEAGARAVVMEIAAATAHTRTLATLLTQVAKGEDGAAGARFAAVGELLDWLQRNNQSLAKLRVGAGEELRRALTATEQVFEAARKVAVDPESAETVRLAAVRLLGRGPGGQEQDVEILLSLLAPQVPAAVQLAGVAALGRQNRSTVPERLLAGWSQYSPKVRAAVLDLLVGRAAWAQVLLDAAEKDPALRAQIDPARRTVLTQHSNPKLSARAAAVFQMGGGADRRKVVDQQLVAMRGLKGEAKRGEAGFANVCSACHRFGETPGRDVGPDLAVVKDRSAEYLVTHILDPNRAVEDRYVFYTATLHDGRTPVGMLARESSGSITLVGLDGAEQVVLRSELRSLISSGRSLMPEGLEGALDPQAMADLVTFLAGSGKRDR
ncbi:MAG: HEAT repeat domain-containing protein [Verrucomicrobia bacterium]|nr:HEAT repeat domain-containing protein [Verrucomicrobiota bacterium]